MHDSSPDLATASHRRFSAVAIVLHWTIATLIVTNIALAWRFDDLKGLAQFKPDPAATSRSASPSWRSASRAWPGG
ncbi:MAG: hypothetical protein WDM92_15010 [Caulobacteraceae bacterium]